jgi:hypothetical protein
MNQNDLYEMYFRYSATEYLFLGQNVYGNAFSSVACSERYYVNNILKSDLCYFQFILEEIILQ